MKKKDKCLVIKNWLNNTDHSYSKLLSNLPTNSKKNNVILWHTSGNRPFLFFTSTTLTLETELLEETTSNKIVKMSS
jgi:hypothetical protein